MGTTGPETGQPGRKRVPGVLRVKTWPQVSPSGWAWLPIPKCKTKCSGERVEKEPSDPKSIFGVWTQALGLKRGRVGVWKGREAVLVGVCLVCLDSSPAR